MARPAAGRGNPGDDDDDGDAAGQPVRVHSSASQVGVNKPAGVPASVFDAGRMAGARAGAQAAATKPRVQRTIAQPLDLDSIAIDLDVPPPAMPNARAALADSCRALLAKMPLGASVVLSQLAAKALIRAAKQEKGCGTSWQAQADGTWRVWKVAATPRKPRHVAAPPPGGDAQAHIPAALSDEQRTSGEPA